MNRKNQNGNNQGSQDNLNPYQYQFNPNQNGFGYNNINLNTRNNYNQNVRNNQSIRNAQGIRNNQNNQNIRNNQNNKNIRNTQNTQNYQNSQNSQNNFVNYSDKGFNTNIGKPQMDQNYQRQNINFNNVNVNVKQKNKKSFIFKFFIILLLILVLSCFCFVYYYFKMPYRANSGTNLILNNNNITDKLKNEIIIDKSVIYMSENDIKTYFDKYLIKIDDKYISTYDSNIAEISSNSNDALINNEAIVLKNGIIYENGITYFPISELNELYDIDITYNNEDNVIISSNSRKLISYKLKKSTNIYTSTGILKRVVTKLPKDSIVYVREDAKEINGYISIRDENGNCGYVKKEYLTDEKIVNFGYTKQKQINDKVCLVWEYFTKSSNIPKYDEKIDGINVVSPSFFQLTDDGNIKVNIGDEGKDYIKWAKDNGYKIWPMIQNDTTNGMEVTSLIMNNYNYRKNLILNIVDLTLKYDLDGINIDFENMKKEDIDMFSRFIIELMPYMEKNNKVVSVDVTAPDGADTWSLCFDRYVLGNVADYLIFMAYDQYGASSTTPGTTAGYDWIENSVKKFINNYEVKPDKIILGLPFYTRLWKTQNDKTTSSVVPISKIDEYTSQNMKYDEDKKQYYREYDSNGAKYQIWIEDNTSLFEKISLVKKYDLQGVAFWQMAFANSNIFSKIKEVLD